ncbi:MAG TPA: asparaginase [Candidatus Baltobacteraceae bacterium]|nr:asparaginase [Candidatus Baltobacteraceae bacterium]
MITVEVTRGDLVESIHHVAACAVDAGGDVVYANGDVDAPVYLRSAAKPFIAAAAIAAGVVDRFGLDSREIAVMAASHFGEPFHVDAVASILRKIGLDESALQCGAHLPYDESSAHDMLRRGLSPSAIYNNCSGKHAGILALCKVVGADTTRYLEVSNPAQRTILEFCARISDDDARTWPLGTDGCGIPVYATGLKHAALSFARLASPQSVAGLDGTALRTVRDAMIAHPEYVAGTGQLDTVLMQAAGGSLACKGGAEGVHGIAILPQGVGLVTKALDGAGRARGPSTLALLRELGAIDAAKATELVQFGRPIVYNRAGRAVGEIRASGVAIEKASQVRKSG